MKKNFGLYVVLTNPVTGYEECARASAGEGAYIIQLRMKKSPRDEVIKTAESVKKVLDGTDSLFIVNDDAEIARLVDADGVHLGQGDMDIVTARTLWTAPDKIFGLSTHGQNQHINAIPKNPDYIGVGPVFPTPSKEIPDPVLGLEQLQAIVSECPLVMVAIGGINHENLSDVLETGVKNYAVVRCVCGSENPGLAVKKLKEIERRYL